MKFVELNRAFMPIEKGQEASVEVMRLWGHRYSGAIHWPELRQYHRVILLAEASSGKTEEFRNQAALLRKEGHAAFFVRIEELADTGFEAALDPGVLAAFKKWQKASSAGWFFLDSIDEARLNRKSFETALKNIARVLGPALNRSHIFISCRVSDWAGDKDRESVERILPAYKPAISSKSGGDKLLDPIFKKEEEEKKETKKEKAIPLDLQVFQLGSLTSAEYKLLASQCGVTDVTKFSNAVVQNGLDMFTERPGDVIELASYWSANKKFASFEKMTEHAINLKLREDDAHRADNGVLSDAKARAGAELVAAALTLGKTFTLRVPSHAPDPTLAQGAIDLAIVLPDWSPAERNALSRRAVFAPATYGRIRFHHRTTQEFLAAKWLDGLLKSNCPLQEVWNLIFAERYGVETVVASLQAEAAWLALWNTAIRDEIIRREPLALVRNGDPASLPIATREALLAAFAKKQAEGNIYNDSLDHRALWMFADAKLDKSIRAAWKFNTRTEFRLDLLRIIREGEIYGCSDLALATVLDPKADKYTKIVASEILAGEGKAQSLKKLAALFKRDAAAVQSRVAASYAHALFPKYLSVKELLGILSRVQLGKKASVDSIGYHLADFYEACPDRDTKEEFAVGLAALCFRKPFVETHYRVSSQYYELAKGMEAVARKMVAELPASAEPSPGIVATLMVVERAERHIDLGDKPSLRDAVMTHQKLNRALFWADVAEDAAHETKVPSTRHWHIYLSTVQLWGFSKDSLPWLKKDLKRKRVQDRQIAFSAILAIEGGDLKIKEAELRKLIGKDVILNTDLNGYLSPPTPHPSMLKWEKQKAARAIAEAIETKKNKKSWKVFCAKMKKKVQTLRDPVALKGWMTGAGHLYNLTKWLGHRAGSTDKAAKEWRLLAEGFGAEVAEAYRDGMKILWRITKPVEPTRNPSGSVSYTHSMTLSVEGISIEAAEDPDWVSKLSKKETERAFLHGVYSVFGNPNWLDELLAAKESILAPHIKQILEQEWLAKEPHNTPFLYRYANGKVSAGPIVQQMIIDCVLGQEPPRFQALDYAIRAIKKWNLTAKQRATLMKLARARLKTCRPDERRIFAVRYIALMLVLDVNAATNDFAKWTAAQERTYPGYGEWAFGTLYERHDPIVYGLLDKATVPTLEMSLDLAYQYVRPQDDVVHEGVFSPGMRDAAEGGRNTILTAIIERPGPDAYRAMERLSNSPAIKLRAHRFRELARGKAEKDAELLAWTEAEVVAFQTKHTRPVKTGHDLLLVTASVLADIQHALSRGDLAGQPLLQRAKNEEEMKVWLVEQMNFRAKERFQAYREAQIAFGDKPDVIISSTAAAVEVGIELKHGGKNWTAKDYEKSLRYQLAQDYLKPINRRQGVFVVSNHVSKTWKHPVTNMKMDFPALIAWLASIAETLTSNEDGAIEVRVFGIDAVPKKHAQPHRAKGASKNVRSAPKKKSPKPKRKKSVSTAR